MSEQYTKPRLLEFIEQAFESANIRLWGRIQRAEDKEERLRLLDVTDALKHAKSELKSIIDGDNENA